MTPRERLRLMVLARKTKRDQELREQKRQRALADKAERAARSREPQDKPATKRGSCEFCGEHIGTGLAGHRRACAKKHSAEVAA